MSISELSRLLIKEIEAGNGNKPVRLMVTISDGSGVLGDSIITIWPNAMNQIVLEDQKDLHLGLEYYD